MPPLVRRQGLSERIKARLNVYDFLLWLSEELHESAIDEKLRDWTLPLGVALNFVYMIARANSGGDSSGRRSDDVFGDFDGRGGSGWLAWFASFTAHLLAAVAFFNAFYTFTRTRPYRLFETNIEAPPSTPSARRVKVDSSPSASPMSYFSSYLAPSTAASRAHPDEKNDVWELRIWDPKLTHLELFAFFSPGHVLIYWLFLPTSSLDPRPSVTVVTTILLAALMTAHLWLLKHAFLGQARDEKILQREVLNEYDTKYVHPSLHKPVRDVGVQTRESGTTPRGTRTQTREVDVYTPVTLVNRGFKINPNPSYAKHLGDAVDVRNLYAETPAKRLARSNTTPNLDSPLSSSFGLGSFGNNSYASTSMQTGMASAQSRHSGHTEPSVPREAVKSRASMGPMHQPQPLSRSRENSSMRGDGGSLGVYTHAASPLKKSASHGLLRPDQRQSMGSPLKRHERMVSPAKRPSNLSNISSSGATTASDNLQARLRGLRDHSSGTADSTRADRRQPGDSRTRDLHGLHDSLTGERGRSGRY